VLPILYRGVDTKVVVKRVENVAAVDLDFGGGREIVDHMIWINNVAVSS
jgi:hypothetical protein